MNFFTNCDDEFNNKIVPFWQTKIAFNECATMIKSENGEITANLLFKPTKILEVRDASLEKVYEQGKDYIWEKGTNKLKLAENSEIPYFTRDDLEGRNEDGTRVWEWGETDAGWTEKNPWDEKGRCRFRDALFCTGKFYYTKQLYVTYEHDEVWQGSRTEYIGDYIPKTMKKLNAGEPMKIVFYGDSIFAGCDSSKMHNRKPYQDSFPQFTKEFLEKKFGSEITLHNPSVGGKSSVWGKENAKELAADHSPDLVIIGFGMNDGGRTGDTVAENIQSIIDTVLQTNPECEFIVIAPMVANEKAGFLTTHVQFPEAYKKLSKTGVGFINMFNVHKDILKIKDFSATSGNHINHPNDWLIRVYAMNIIAGFLK